MGADQSTEPPPPPVAEVPNCPAAATPPLPRPKGTGSVSTTDKIVGISDTEYDEEYGSEQYQEEDEPDPLPVRKKRQHRKAVRISTREPVVEVQPLRYCPSTDYSLPCAPMGMIGTQFFLCEVLPALTRVYCERWRAWLPVAMLILCAFGSGVLLGHLLHGDSG